MQTEIFFFGVIREEILAIAEKYGDDRKTAIGYDEYDMSMEDLIPEREYSDHNDQTWIHKENDSRQFQKLSTEVARESRECRLLRMTT